MCGIVGYIGDRNKTIDVLIQGLSRLEYRGYDSSGVALFDNGISKVIKSVGKLENLKHKLEGLDLRPQIGIGHTRWATHGKVTEENAHPHTYGGVTLVHNGIIENYLELKDELIGNGHEFYSKTDSEVVAHLIEEYTDKYDSFEIALRKCVNKIQGSFALVIISEKEPNKIYGVRKFSPLILGLGEQEDFFASDMAAVIPYTNRIIFLEDGDIAVVEKGAYRLLDFDGNEVHREVNEINWDPITIEKGGYRHFMLKEIHEQPIAILDTIRGRVSEETADILFEGINYKTFKSIKKILLLGCGTSYNACLVGKYLIENIAGTPVEVDLASEFRYRNSINDRRTLVVGISQSGETADTSEAIREAKKEGFKTLGITNVEMSKIARESDYSISTKAGPEIGVASTKAFTTQLVVLYLFAIFIARSNGSISKDNIRQKIYDVLQLPKLAQIVLMKEQEIKRIARNYFHYNNFLYLARGISHPIAYEGSLKLKEISYIHAEGYAAGEMKHGPIALIDENMPVVIIDTESEVLHRKLLGNVQEVKARQGKVILITSARDITKYSELFDEVISIPSNTYLLSPVISVIPLQLLAYYIAYFKGTDIDQPRNLAKVVTVE